MKERTQGGNNREGKTELKLRNGKELAEAASERPPTHPRGKIQIY